MVYNKRAHNKQEEKQEERGARQTLGEFEHHIILAIKIKEKK